MEARDRKMGAQSTNKEKDDTGSAGKDGDDEHDESASGRFGSRGGQKRKIETVVTTNRYVGKATTVMAPRDFSVVARAEIDSRADTVCGGSTFELHHDTRKVVDVSGFHPTMDSLNGIKVGTLLTAVDLEDETIIAVFNEGLYFGTTMQHSLIPPAQLWDYNMVCDITPKSKTDGKSIHGIYSPDDDVHIPFQLHGCISYFNTRLPTKKEKQECRWVVMTSEAEWDPYSDKFQKDEDAAQSFFDDPFKSLTRHTYDTDGLAVRFGQAVTTRFISAVSTVVAPPHIDGDDMETFDARLVRSVGATSSKERRTSVDASTLARRWRTSVATAAQTLKTTTQRGVRFLEGPLTRRFRTRQTQLQNRFLKTKMYTDTMFSETKSALGNTCAQLFVTAEGYADGDPLTTKADAYVSLERICRDVGIPKLLVSDGAREEQYGDWGRVVKNNLIQTRITEPYSGWQNRCEDEIREIKKHHRRVMTLNKCPAAFWDFGWRYTLEIRQLIAQRSAGNRPPGETITGETQDASEYTEFEFYEWVKYHDKAGYPDDPVKLGRWLGVSHKVGAPLTFWVLKENGQIVARSTVRPLLKEEWRDEKEKEARKQMDEFILKRHGTANTDENEEEFGNVIDNDELEEPVAQILDDLRVAHGVGGTSDDSGSVNSDENEEKDDVVGGPTPFDGAEVYIPHGDRNEIAKVLGRKRSADGTYVGKANTNPMLDSRVFTIRFPDGDERDVSYNTIAEHLYSQVDEEGNQFHIFREIVSHRKRKGAVDKADQFRVDSSGNRKKKKTTKGWDLEVEWKDGTTSWLPLTELKETNTVEVAEYAVANRIDDEPAFDWWVKDIIRRKQRLIKLSKARHIRRGYKFGIRVPRTCKEALALDAENGNDLWHKAIMKEMNNVRIAFDIRDRDTRPPPGYKCVDLMMVFDIKMDFTRKARLCARGDQTEPPVTLTYASVVSRESVRIAFLVAALNNLEVLMFDIGNAYLNAPASEKIYTYGGIEFGEEDEGKLMVIQRALYGLKSSGAAYRSFFAQSLRDLDFTACQADADVWRRIMRKKKSGERHYEYILTYVDDCLVVSEDPMAIIKTLQDDYKYRMKDVEPPTRYLGATTGKKDLPEGPCWFMSAESYLTKALTEVEKKWGPTMKRMNRASLDIPAPTGFHPEMDDTPPLDDEHVQLYQSYIGIIRWAVELGRIDLAHVAGVMARFSAAPREGHLAALVRVFAYIKKHTESKIVFDPTPIDFNDINWMGAEWKEFYPEIDGEVLPPNMPEPLGKSVQVSMFCDAAHATCHVTRRSTTGIVFFVNGAPIKWYSKRQNTIESSAFGSEFVALRIAIEQNEALRYKLRMMGIPVDGPTNGFCDNQSVVTNSTVPQSTLQKKHNMVAYHKVRESVAMGAIQLAHEKGTNNLADALTKFLAAPAFRQCCQCMMYRN